MIIEYCHRTPIKFHHF